MSSSLTFGGVEMLHVNHAPEPTPIYDDLVVERGPDDLVVERGPVPLCCGTCWVPMVDYVQVGDRMCCPNSGDGQLHGKFPGWCSRRRQCRL